MLGVEHRGDVTVLRMEHGKANAIDLDLLNGLTSALDMVARSDSVGAVLTGRGSIFSAGVDLFQLVEKGDDYRRQFVPALSESVRVIAEFPRPLVAAVNGHAIAGGCVIACACDWRVMGEGSGRVGVPELRVGVPFPAVPLELVRNLVPPQHLNEVVLFGRTYEPESARELGLLDEVVAADAVEDRAVEVVRDLGSIRAEPFAVTKRQLRLPLLERIARTAAECGAEVERLWHDPATLDAIRAYLEATVGGKRSS